MAMKFVQATCKPTNRSATAFNESGTKFKEQFSVGALNKIIAWSEAAMYTNELAIKRLADPKVKL